MSFISDNDRFVSPATGDRSYLHPVSNTPILQFKDFNPKASLFNGLLPQSGLLKFLHEITHYWTYDSVFGELVFLVAEQGEYAYWSLVDAAYGSDADRLRNAVRVVRCHAAVKLLSPLLEGFALMVEFDALPVERNDYLFLPMRWASRCFIKPQPSMLLKFVKVLMAQRLDSQGVNRKLSALASPLSSTASGYLNGYLATKQLWRIAASDLVNFESCDLFLEFVDTIFLTIGNSLT